MALEPYVTSYYAASAHAGPERPALEGSLECDVCVVGGGIAGCSTALHLAQSAACRVVLLEEHRVGWGASGRSGAQALFGVAAGQAKLERLIGAGAARTVWDVSRRGARAHARAHRPAPASTATGPTGYLLTAVKERHDARAARRARRAQRHATATGACATCAREELRALLGTERYLGALYDSNSGHLHPLNYTPRTRGRGRGRGRADLRGHARPALRRRRRAPGARDARARGEVRARYLVLCGNVYLGATAPPLASQDHGGRHLHRRDRAAGCGARAAADRQQRRGQRHELGAGLFPALGRSPPAVRRPRQLLGPALLRCAERPRVRACWRVSAAAGRAHRLRLGRRGGHHPESRPALRPPGAERVLPAGLLRPRHRAHRHRRQAGRGGDRRHRGALRRVRAHPARQLPRRRWRCAARRWCWRCSTTGIRDLL